MSAPTSMRALPATTCYAGFAIGPAHVCRTWNDLVATQMLSMPAIVVAPYLDSRQLGTIAFQRVYGVALEHGSFIDPMWEELSNFKKPTMFGCQGIMDEVKQGDLVAIDGEEGLVFVRPEGEMLAYYRDRKGTKCRRDPQWVTESIRRMADAIRQARYGLGYRPPLDLPREATARLLEIGRRVAGGHLPSDDDDRFVHGLMTPPRVEPLELPDV